MGPLSVSAPPGGFGALLPGSTSIPSGWKRDKTAAGGSTVFPSPALTVTYHRLFGVEGPGTFGTRSLRTAIHSDGRSAGGCRPASSRALAIVLALSTCSLTLPVAAHP